MVGYGSSLRQARRQGWYDAYLDYDRLKRILHEIEALYTDLSVETAHVDSIKKALSHDAPRASTTEHAALLVVEGGRRQRIFSDPTHSTSDTMPNVAYVKSANARLDDANQKARVLAEKFLDLVHSEVEKVFLFALARQGEIADAVGSLRFASSLLRLSISSGELTNLSTMKSSSVNDGGDESSDEENEDEAGWGNIGDIALGETAALLPRSSMRLPPQAIPFQGPMREFPMFQGKGVTSSALSSTQDDHSSGDMDVLHSYSSLGVELLHLVRYICVNAMG